MQKDELLALAERVEALSGPDREVDSAIVLALFPVTRVPNLGPNGKDAWYDHDLIFAEKSWNFTASLDAAMTLVPEGWTAIEMRSRNAMARWVVEISKLRGDNTEHLIQGHAATPALALVAAALRALAGGE